MRRKMCSLAGATAGALVFIAGTAQAQVGIIVEGIGRYEYNSNVFDLQHGYVFPGTEIERAADSDFVYGGVANLKYQWSRQTFYADGSADEYQYNDFTDLDHHEYRLDAGWNGQVGRVFDANFEVIRNSAMVPFIYVFQAPVASITTEQREQGGFGIQFLPTWRIEASAYRRTVDWPLPDEPNLRLDESEGAIALKYQGAAGLTAGISTEGYSGDFHGAPVELSGETPSYKQTTTSLVAAYAGNTRSTMIGQIGYSDRTSANGLNSISGVTGALEWNDQLTGKTTFDLKLQRLISAYITNDASVFTSEGTANVTWQATYKIGVSVSYDYNYSLLPAQGDLLANGTFTDRHDHLQTTAFSINYAALRWLTIKPYIGYQDRSSDFESANFSAVTFGLSLAVQWQNAAQTTNSQSLSVVH